MVLKIQILILLLITENDFRRKTSLVEGNRGLFSG